MKKKYDVIGYVAYIAYMRTKDKEAEIRTDFRLGMASDSNVRHATDSEKQLLLDKMHEAGYDWDAEKCEVVTYKWRPEDGECYFVPAALSHALYHSYTFSDSTVDCMYLERGLICKTEEDAVNMAKKMLEA